VVVLAVAAWCGEVSRCRCSGGGGDCVVVLAGAV